MPGYAPEYIQRLQQEFAEAVEDLLTRHLLWNAQVLEPAIEPTEPCMLAIVQLNDGRSWLVHMDIKTGELTVTKQALTPEFYNTSPPF